MTPEEYNPAHIIDCAETGLRARYLGNESRRVSEIGFILSQRSQVRKC